MKVPGTFPIEILEKVTRKFGVETLNMLLGECPKVGISQNIPEEILGKIPEGIPGKTR